MNINYSLSLICSVCKADILLTGNEERSDPYLLKKLGRKYESPKPKIKWSFCKQRQAELRKAKQYVAKFPSRTQHEVYDTSTAIVNTPLPKYVDWKPNALANMYELVSYVHLVDTRFVPCPACGGKAYLDSRIKSERT